MDEDEDEEDNEDELLEASIEFEVLGVSEFVFQAKGKKAGASWVCFDIRQPHYPHRTVPIYLEVRPKASSQAAAAAPLQRRELPHALMGKLYVAAGPVDDKELGTLDYNVEWTAGDHIEPEAYSISLRLLDQDCQRIHQWVLAGRCPSLVKIVTPDIETTYVGYLTWKVGERDGSATISDARFTYLNDPLPVAVADNEDKFDRVERLETEARIREAILGLERDAERIRTILKSIDQQIIEAAKLIGRIILVTVGIYFLSRGAAWFFK